MIKIRTKFLLIILVFLVSACGNNSANTNSVIYNTMFINLQNGESNSQFSLTNELFNQDTEDYNSRVGADVLFQDNSRIVTFSFGELDSGLLGHTQCNYYSDGTSSCSITITPSLNPDEAESSTDQETRSQTFFGVLRHELGHAFGMGHIKDDPNNVMYPTFNVNQLQEQNVQQYFENLNNFRVNGAASGLPNITVE